MPDGNYIKLYRGMLEWEWYSDINTKVLFLHMLLKANWKEGKFHGTTVPRGSFVSSIKNLSLETNLSERNVRTAILHLKSTGEVTSEATSKYTVFTVVHYNRYQTSDKQDDEQVTSERQTSDKQVTTIEERKNSKNINNIFVAPSPPSPKAEKEESKYKKNSFEMLCVEQLIRSCLESFPNSKVPCTEKAKEKWAAEIDKMKRLDKRSEEDIKKALEFAMTDPFWKSNIRSTKTLREKFERLILQYNSKHSPKQQSNRTNQFAAFPQREYKQSDYSSIEKALLNKKG